MSNFSNEEIIELIKHNRIDRAKAFIHQLEQSNGTTSEIYLLHALLNIKIENYENAWLWLWRGLDEFPQHPQINLLMADICKLRNQLKESDYYLQRAITFNIDAEYTQKIASNTETLRNALTGSQKNEPLRILQGTIEIANQMNTLSSALAKQSIFSKTLNYYPYYLNYSSDYTWSMLKERNSPDLNKKLRRLAERFLSEYHLFHFHFGTTFTLDYSDLPIFDQWKKPLIMQHWGSDIRLQSKASAMNPYALVKNKNEDQIKYSLSILSKHIKNCIVSDMELYQYVHDFYEHTHIIPALINTEIYTPQKNHDKNPRPLIVHAPTSPHIKGTAYIMKAIEDLQPTYHFDFQLVQGKSHSEAVAMYQKADIIIDQLHIGSYGLLAVESMAIGKTVICYISDFMKDHYPKELPIISANPDTIKMVLEKLLNNQDQLPEVGIAGRNYIEQHHDMVKNSQKVLELYQTFFKNK
ncbi:glycosyltransferase [Neobacillus sp. MM2021_6]|uniref:glycosyltransferase n=1 Tax=Bacillaceae TaxID=186817 RepID=UPI00140C2F15|nr:MULTISPECIES: glycosyltransferase [Bacillaceae]MBO0961859.1 glycosyltransferase [Neobacillus sp. MM2021_6]NHC18974.1 glycosyltransferase [Bacillus sp. MM2020_4]